MKIIRILRRVRKLLLVAVLLLGGCASLPKEGRIFLDSTIHRDSAPAWVKETKVSWEDKDKLFVRASHTIRGNERINACFDLAKLDSKENILSEIANDVRGTLDNAQESISEDAEVVLGKVRSSEFSGRITGLRFLEQYFERYIVGASERVDCHVLSEIKNTDYNRIKREVVDRITAIDPKIKEAVRNKHVDFFAKKASPEAEQPQKENLANSDKE